MADPSDFSVQAVEVRRALASYDPFRHGSEYLDVRPGPNGVEIHGAVRTDAIARSALHWVRTHVGDVPLVNCLVADNVLEAEVAHALATDPRTRAEQFRVGAYLGQVAVAGPFSAVDHKAVLEVAQSISGVRGVDMSTPSLPADAQPIATMAMAMSL